MEQERIQQLKIVQEICQAIADKKGMNTLVLDVTGISSMADFFIIAEGNVDRHIKAISEHIQGVCKKYGIRTKKQAGISGGEWIVLDFQDIVIHLFTPDMRHKYRLEEIWNAGKIVSCPVQYTKIEKPIN